LAPVIITSTPPGNCFDRTVLPESRELGLFTQRPQYLDFLSQRIDALFRVTLGELNGGLHHHHRPSTL
jgi:hypothetical protein